MIVDSITKVSNESHTVVLSEEIKHLGSERMVCNFWFSVLPMAIMPTIMGNHVIFPADLTKHSSAFATSNYELQLGRGS